MSLTSFLESPWKNSHRAYEDSAFNIRPAPEFATGEVVIASTYRASGFLNHQEHSVPEAGRQLDRAAGKKRIPALGEHTGISQETWRTVLHGALESPKQPKQSARRFLQLCPIVPDAALYSGSARLSGNSWNPGSLVARIVQLGCSSGAAAEALWANLHAGLSVGNEDDIWARWLQEEFERRKVVDQIWQETSLLQDAGLPSGEKVGLRAPAGQFVRDMASILRAKNGMTRRQWISLLEAILRLGTVAHVLWLCDTNSKLWRLVLQVLDGAEPPSHLQLLESLLQQPSKHLVYGKPALPIVKDLASRYLMSRLGLNLALWHLEEMATPIQRLQSIGDWKNFLDSVAAARGRVSSSGFGAMLERLEETENRTLGCNKGIGSNLVEFCRYTLGQRQTADENLRGYDQGYQLKKRAEYASAPWVVALGPVALLALAHCCMDEVSGPRSVHRLCEHLAWYLLDVDMNSVANSDLGRDLRMLGLILDSPDAESGMLLVPLFELRRASALGASK